MHLVLALIPCAGRPPLGGTFGQGWEPGRPAVLRFQSATVRRPARSAKSATLRDQLIDALQETGRDEYEIVAAGPATDEQVAALEAALGLRVPAPLRDLLGDRLNGLAVLARIELWPPAEPYDVGPAWTFWPGLVVLGVGGEDLPGWASIEVRALQLREAGITDVVPAFVVHGDGDRTWGLRPDGSVVLTWSTTGEVDELGTDLATAYREEVAALRQRTADMVALRRERGEL
ncbi:SMI1/KNR4 family protein [Pimelobacter simplex]|uniref:SMI1/KNR4 family protein n=1 Tax=Nocardioides simplex TaxID=2045 RepID=UPI003672380E